MSQAPSAPKKPSKYVCAESEKSAKSHVEGESEEEVQSEDESVHTSDEEFIVDDDYVSYDSDASSLPDDLSDTDPPPSSAGPKVDVTPEQEEPDLEYPEPTKKKTLKKKAEVESEPEVEDDEEEEKPAVKKVEVDLAWLHYASLSQYVLSITTPVGDRPMCGHIYSFCELYRCTNCSGSFDYDFYHE